MSKFVCIQGNIGSGKSTLLRELEKKGYAAMGKKEGKRAAV
jgi:predicted ATPase